MKKALLTLLQILVTVGILAWVFRDPAKRGQMFAALRNADLAWVSAAILAYAFVEIVATVRWAILLRVQQVVLPPLRLFALLMIGIFFNLFMPGGTGGDVIKIFYLLKETPGKKTAALLATLMDRVVGLLGLMIIAAAMLALRYDFLKQTETTRHLTWSLLAIVLASFVGIGFSFLITGLRLAHKLPARMPGRDLFIDLSAAYHAYAHAWGASLGALGLSFLVHAGSFLVFYFGLLSLGLSARLMDVFAVVPIINTLTSLPVSIGGAGVREYLSQELFSQLCGIPPASAVAVSLIAFLVLAFWAVVGGLIYLAYRPSEHAKLRQIKEEVHALEHTIATDEEK